MAARKKVTKGRTTKKPAKARAPAKAVTKKKVTHAKPSPKAAAKKPKAAATKPKAAATKPKAAATKPKASVAHATHATLRRRDATGHLDPKYAADLRARTRASAEDLGNDNAFLRKSRTHDTLAEELGEDAVATMTSGEDQSERLQDMAVDEENGGPFVTTTGREEYARGTDKSNPRGATREPFPTT